MGRKVQSQLLAGRTGGAVGSQTEPVRVEDEWLDNDNQDDGTGSDKEMSEVGGASGVRVLNSVMVMTRILVILCLVNLRNKLL